LVHELLRQQALAREARRVGLEGRPDVARRLGRLSDQVLAEALVAQVRSDADVSEAALRAYYRDEADRFRSAPRRKLRHLLAASETEARAALEAIVAGQAFANVAAERSRDAQTRAQGGDLGWVPRGVMVAAFDEAAFALPVGIPSTPVRTSFGWHLILVEEIDPGSLPPFELIADRVKEALQTARVDAVLQRLIDPGSIVVDRAALESLK
jgi:parvulin-like peptidyl-prolyl isomerase